MTRTRSITLGFGVPAVIAWLATLGLVAMAPAASATASPTVVAVNNFPVIAGQSDPLGDVTVTEATPGQLAVGDVITYQFEDSASAATTLHFSTAGTVSGTNGIAATVAVGSADDVMQVTITAASSGSFPGVLTLSGLTAAADSTAGTGNDKVLVSDTNHLITAQVSDADVIAAGTAAPYAAQSTPTIPSTSTSQLVGNVVITEPAKLFFHNTDVITLSLRDTDGTADTIGLAATPTAAGGSMTVSVTGANGSNVQQNDTAFKVNIVSQDPSNGSSSTITISNIVVNTAEAPLGPVTLSAVITAGPDAGTKLIAPGRVAIANAGGNTTTTASGSPVLAASTTAQPAGNVTIAATAGSLHANDTISLQLQSAGVTFTAASAPIATVTSGSLVFGNALATLDQTGTIATWTVTTGNVSAATIVIGPIYYDVGGTATAGEAVTLLASGESGSAFTPQVVQDAVVVATPAVGGFATTPASIPSDNTAPFDGANIVYTEASAGSTPVGSDLVLISPYAAQIAAYRTTFAAIPSVATTNGLTLGTASVNSSAIVVATENGTITAPAQTVAIFPVTAASTGTPGTVTFSSLSFSVGNLVPPGTLVATSVVEASSALTTASAGNQVVDLIDTHDLGTTSATTPPVVTLTQNPPAFTNLNSATFAYVSNEAGSTFACALDTVVVSLNCPSPITLPGLSNGTHTFTVQAFNPSGFGSATVSYTWTINNVPPSASVILPTTLTGSITVNFSEPVEFINSSNATLAEIPASGSPVPLAVTMTCTPQGGVSGACGDTSFYPELSIQPTAQLVPGDHYALTLDPAGVSPPITDQEANILATVSDAFRGGLIQDENSPAAVPRWSSVKSTSASGGSYSEDHAAGAAASFAFTGTSVTWQTVDGPNQGEAKIYVDNVFKETVNNYAKTMQFKIARTITGLVSGPHILKIVVTGVKGSTAGTDAEVAVDAFAVGTTVTQDGAAGVSYVWALKKSSAATGGAYALDDVAGAKYSFTFRGTAVTWVTVFGPSMGEAAIYVDGALKGTVNNYSDTVAYLGKRTVSGLTDAVHTLQVVVLGKHATAATGSNVAVDGFVVT